MAIVEFKNTTKDYGDGNLALDKLNLKIKEGEFVTLIGPSGCGKTTTLKLINSLIEPTSGEIYVYGKELSKWNKIDLRRSIGYVIQQVGLFPHMTISQNISYVLKIKKEDKENYSNRTKELIELVGLEEDCLDKYPRELSGGQQQRVGVARALAADPPIILMDEPFGAIDEITRKKLQDELIKLHKKLQKTIIFVTHDINEAIKLGSKIVLLKNGRLIMQGSKEDVFFNEKGEYVKEFFGIKNFTSYMNITPVKEGIDRGYPNIKLIRNKPVINSMDISNIEYIPVINSKGQYLGLHPIDYGNLKFDRNKIIKSETINENDSIMSALEIQFRQGRESIPVVDNEERYIGMFEVNKAYQNMFKKLNSDSSING